MSQENVELIRSAYEAGNRRDFDFFASRTMDEFELESAITRRTFRGTNAFRRLYDELSEAFGEYQMLVEEMIDAGEHVVAMIRIEAVGRGSGLPVAQRGAQVWTFRDGRLFRAKGYLDRQQALEAVGLSE